MKLLKYTTRKYLSYSVPIFLFFAMLIALVIRLIAIEEIDERMQATRQSLTHQLQQGVELKSSWPYWEIIPLGEITPSLDYDRDTLVVTPVENEVERFRQLKSLEQVGGKNYLIIVRKPQMEWFDLFVAIGLPMILFILILLLVLLWVNHQISYKVWQPFQSNLDQLNRFSVSDIEPIRLGKSQIDELESLRTALLRLTEKGRADFRNLKELAENASHELQTPLAIITAQLEQLINSHTLNESLAGDLERIYGSVQRLTKMNKSLLLLSRIENRQYEPKDQVNLSDEIKLQLDQFSELFKTKSLSVSTTIVPAVIRQGNQELIRILLTNLIGNALVHNLSQGRITIQLSHDRLVISNTGPHSAQDPMHWLTRFTKANPAAPSAGLGLAIVKEIVELHGWGIDYRIENSLHTLTLRW